MEAGFHGQGYSGTALTEAEIARMRHMFSEVSEDWPTLKKTVTLIHATVILYEIVKIGAPVLALIMGAGFYLKNTGVF